MDESEEAVNEVTAYLASVGYRELFEVLEPKKLRAILARPGWMNALPSVVRDPHADMKVRFLAAELCFDGCDGFPDAASLPALADVYAHALKTSPVGNRWGSPSGWPGRAGDHLVKIGQPMVAKLLPILTDLRLLPWEGSIEATTASLEKYRYADVAAYLLSRILGRTYDFDRDPAVRLKAIEKLRREATSKPAPTGVR